MVQLQRSVCLQFVNCFRVRQVTGWGRNQWSSADRMCCRIKQSTDRDEGFLEVKKPKQISNTKASSERSEQVLRSRNLSRWTLLQLIAALLQKVTSTPSSKSLMYKRERKTSFSPIMWIRCAKRTLGWFYPSPSRCKDSWISRTTTGESRENTGHNMAMCMC